VINFHGYQAYNNPTDHIAKLFSDLGLVYLAYDTRGHGNSQGNIHIFDSVDTLINDAKEFITLIKGMDEYKGLPLIIGGESMGGLIAYHLSLESPDDYLGVYLFAPALRSPHISLFRSLFRRTLLATISYIYPSLNIPLDDSSVKRDICSNEVTLQRIFNDPFFKTRITNTSTVRALLNKMSSASSTFKNYQANFIAFIGDNDKLVDPNIIYDLLKDSKSTVKEGYIYEGVLHHLVGEEVAFDVFERLKSFCKKVLTFPQRLLPPKSGAVEQNGALVPVPTEQVSSTPLA